MTLAEAAIASGFPVFACALNKRPITAHGFHDATRNADEIVRQFANSAAALIGMPTGEASGWDALDIDPRNGGIEWEATNAHRLPETRVHETPSGGRHYIFLHAPGVRNSAGVVAPGVDVRGTGGYICVPGSPNYRVISDAEPAHWPDWLLELVLKRPRDEPAPVNGHPHAPISSKRIAALVDAVARRVASAPEGQKHYTLRNQALYLGGLLHLGQFSPAEAVNRLVDALPASTADRKLARKTVEWGVKHGADSPIDLPDREQYRGNGTAAPPDEIPPPLSDQEGETNPSPSPDIPGHTRTSSPDIPALRHPLILYDDIQPNTQTIDFVENVLVERGSSVVYGESNAGKTFFATDIALHVAAGMTWRDKQVTQGGVVYLAIEGSMGFQNRIAAWRDGIGHDRPVAFAAITTSVDLLRPDADVPHVIQSINRAAQLLGMSIKLVVVDTLSRAMAGGNENAPDDMGALVKNQDEIRAATGSSIMWIHHSGKDAARGARGHSLLRAAIDTEIELSADGPARIARVTKQRDLIGGEEFGFALKIVELGTNGRGKPVTSCVVDHGTPDAPTAPRRPRLTGHSREAFEILCNLVAGQGQPGFKGTPAGAHSVPQEWWRDRFYGAAMPGADQGTKQKAFRRASDSLVQSHVVAMADGRVWLPAAVTPQSYPQTPDNDWSAQNPSQN